MSSIEVHVDRPKCTVLSTQYHMIIDTETKIDSQTYGTYQKMYDPDDKDEFLSHKDIKSAKLELRRKINSGTSRYLHLVNLTNKESVRGIAKLFGFTYEWKEDTRSRLIDTDKVVVIDYSDKSVAIFSKDPEVRKKIKTIEDKLKYNRSLTGPKMEKQPGWILAKSNKEYASIITMLDTGGDDGVTSTEDMQFEGNGVDQIDSDITTGNDRLRIWGDETWIQIKLEEIEDDSSIKHKVLNEKTLSGNRTMIEIELIPE